MIGSATGVDDLGRGLDMHHRHDALCGLGHDVAADLGTSAVSITEIPQPAGLSVVVVDATGWW